MKTYTITQVRQLLNVDNKTLARWLDRAGITPQDSEHDSRVKRISREQLERLASIHERTVGALPVEKEVHPTVKALERKVTEQAERLERLEREIAFEDDISDRVDTLAERIASLEKQIEELRELTLQRIEKPRKPREVAEHTPDTLPSENAPTTRNKAIVETYASGIAPYRIMINSLDELPGDAIPLSEFAQQHGIENTKGFRERIDKYFAHYAYRNERRPREVQRFVTAEQQAAVLKQ